jgi:RES domain-containing protein
LRFRATCYRAHDPRWSFRPVSGAGAAIHGGRFNTKGSEALYLSLDVVTAVKEANQGFSAKIHPCTICSYEVDCEDVEDLRTPSKREALGVSAEDLGCAWFAIASAGKEPPSWRIAERLRKQGRAGIIVPSFAPGATLEDQNLVLWRWGSEKPHKVRVFDPGGRLPKDQLSWR